MDVFSYKKMTFKPEDLKVDEKSRKASLPLSDGNRFYVPLDQFNENVTKFDFTETTTGTAYLESIGLIAKKESSESSADA